ncbi:organic radical activating enzyme [Hydrogenivirga caldilitoris]|uniref:7-carboxy-7-deazaguanine synthase n=1 Tax=Hydrogenivirga caldilitoris TaxID=246264 RepID=A0A497XT39_9AQUI|nr:7-carboxy-7-deazaguanine synthase QueE [Hydrogenivirga caldilitoris]RLJ71431.1 organic radical activating enzyme [Hydrogenivirga caldilitoris]
MLRDKVRATHTLSVNEIYETVQGEGLLVGTPSLFIRLQGCNLRCPWCDQPEALEFKRKPILIEELLKKLSTSKTRHVVITGGEPLAHSNVHILVKTLLGEGFSVQIETNGTLWNEGLEDVAERIHITCSPKAVANFFVHPKILMYAKELKFVVDEELSEESLLREEFKSFLEKGVVVLQPEGNKQTYISKALVIQDLLLERGFPVRVIPQIHKFLGIR